MDEANQLIIIYYSTKLYQKWGAKRSFQFPMVEINLKFPVGLNNGNILVKSFLRLGVNELDSLEI